jgi:hypothetical protein
MGMVVNFFFEGFVIGKVPFALSPRFKPMLQVRRKAWGLSRRAGSAEKHRQACDSCSYLVASDSAA